MFDWLNYKKRLKSVRAELVDVDDKASVYVSDDKAPQSIRDIALCVCRIARILVRVVDSLPGKDD